MNPAVSAPPRAFITGIAGTRLNPAERAFLAEYRPWGLILFARNCTHRRQIAALCAEFRLAVGRNDAPVFIDQEGGRVQRLRPPLAWRYPAAAWIGAIDRVDNAIAGRAAFLYGRLIAEDLAAIGITADCLPVLDVRRPETHDVIGDRAFSDQPETVAQLARRQMEGLMAGGVSPVMKHIPGHGRATADSHFDLPQVDAPLSALEGTDFVPFIHVNDCGMAMTAHVIYEALDAGRPATLSPSVVGGVIRGIIGFDGLLMTDDLSMKALKGPMEGRARAALDAGCDMLLHCNGDMPEMEAVADAAPVLEGKALERAGAAIAPRNHVETGARVEELRAEFLALMARFPA